MPPEPGVRHSAAMQSADRRGDWHVWWRRGFGTALVLALVVGLVWAFQPSGFEDEPVVAGDEEASERPRRGADKPKADDEDQLAGGDESEASEDTGLSDEEAEELIDAARPPEETTVQVLDAGGGSTATNDAADALRELGYDVVAINTSRLDYPTTTVLFTQGNEAEAVALRARDERFAETGLNERLSEGVDVHIVVGPDWTD